MGILGMADVSLVSGAIRLIKSTYISYNCEEEYEIQTKTEDVRFTVNIYCDECQSVHTFILKGSKKTQKRS